MMTMPNNSTNSNAKTTTIPGMGERYARLGYGAQDRLAADLILQALKSPSFVSVRLADLGGGKVDDFVLVWSDRVQGNSVKWTGTEKALAWGDLCGGDESLIRQLADGWKTLKSRWTGRQIEVCLRTNKAPSTGTHGNQLVPLSLESFLTDAWPKGGPSTHHDGFQAAWDLVEKQSGLNGAEFSDFIASCRILTSIKPPADDSGTLDAVQWQREFDRLKQAINERLEINPDREEFSAAEIRQSIGLSSSRLVQRFPLPDIGYEENVVTALRVREAVAGHDAGYIALTGPAGAGKSTLASIVIQDEPFGIPYFAFLPNGQGDPRERGDALAFYRHLIAVLDQWGSVRRAHGIADLAQAREALAAHMNEIHQRYIQSGHKTIILIDGLDHVTREEGLDRPLQVELPRPEELQPGCVILLSTQPQALTRLRLQIRRQLEETSRTIAVEPLPLETMHCLLGEEAVGHKLNDKDRQFAAESCGGNPLILTYLIKALRSTPGSQANEVIERLGAFSGDIGAYYAEHFIQVLDMPDAKRLLGLLCRVRNRIPLAWLQDWPEWGEFERLYRSALAPFFNEEGGSLAFVHNSLLTYLLQATLPNVPGSNSEMAAAKLFQELARRCPDTSPIVGLSRDRLYYQVMAGDHEAVVSTATPEWFREGANAFIPVPELSQLLRLCYRSAAAIGNYGAILRFAAISKEIQQRDTIMDGPELADAFLRLGQPMRALEQIADGVVLRVERAAAMRFAGQLADYGQNSGDAEALLQAKRLFDLTKPVSLLYSSEPVDVGRNQQLSDLAVAWAEVAPFFVPTLQLLREIQDIKLSNSDNDPDSAPANVLANLLFSLLDIVHERDDASTDSASIVDAIYKLGNSDWSIVARIRRCKYLQMTGSPESQEECRALIDSLDREKLSESVALAVAERLWTGGMPEQAKELVEGLSLPSPRTYFAKSASELAGFYGQVRLSRLRAALGLSPLFLSRPDSITYEGAARVAAAAVLAGELLGTAVRGDGPPHDLEERLKRLLNFRRIPAFYPSEARHEHHSFSAQAEVFDVLISVASALGKEGRNALRKVFLKVCQPPLLETLASPFRRKFALGLYRMGALTADEADDVISQATSDAAGHETAERTKACFEIAEAFYELGDTTATKQWTERAGRAAHGIGYHKDYQMAIWASWLERSLPDDPSGATHPLAQIMARLLEVAGGRSSREAAESLVRSCFRRHPIVGARLALELIERGTLDFDDALSALVETASSISASPDLLEPVFSRLLTLTSMFSVGATAKCVVAAGTSHGAKLDLASNCAQAIRINCQPEFRLTALQNIRDALTEAGLDAPNFESGLADNSENKHESSTAYKLNDGSSLSIAELAALLSDPRREAEWNENPKGNEFFHWAEALEKIAPQSAGHLAKLEQKLAPNWRYPGDCLAALAVAANLIGDFELSRQYATRAAEVGRDGGWIRMSDGAPKRQSYEKLIQIDPTLWEAKARADFEADLIQGRIGYGFTDELDDIFDALRVSWPHEETLRVMEFYLAGMSLESDLPEPYESLEDEVDIWSADEALGWFLVQQLAHPVDLIGASTRIAIADYIENGGKSMAKPFQTISQNSTIVAEQALMALDMASRRAPRSITNYRPFIEASLSSPSAAVRLLAGQLCQRLRWPLPNVEFSTVPLVYKLSMPPSAASFLSPGQQAAEISSAPLGLALEIYEAVLRYVSDVAEISYEAVLVRARQFYAAEAGTYPWLKNRRAKLQKWRDSTPVLQYVQPEALVARDAVMRVISELKACGLLPQSFYMNYEALIPAYDGTLDRVWPVERPQEIIAMPEPKMGFRAEKWHSSFSSDDLLQSPTRIDGHIVLGEWSVFGRPEWDQPKEFRISSPVPSRVPLYQLQVLKHILPEVYGMTASEYRSETFNIPPGIVLINNHSRELSTPASGWLAISPVLAHSLDWELTEEGLFRWVDSEGSLMVESVWWRDGVPNMKPPRFVTMGHGWLVLCTEKALKEIQIKMPPLRSVLFGQRSYSDEKSKDRRLKSMTAERPLG